MNHQLSIVRTADGSNTIFNSEVGEHYHSRNGALQESRHVFLNSGLKYFLSLHHTNNISVLEVGFGTGLNFLLSAEYCKTEKILLDYTGIEAYPLSAAMLQQTGYNDHLPQELWEQFIQNYEGSFKHPVQISNCKLQINRCKLLDFRTENLYDVIYFDAFASAYQPEMWNEKAIAHTLGFLKPGGIFVTYAITGDLKRIIKALGLKVEKAPGAPGKREMLRAVKTA